MSCTGCQCELVNNCGNIRVPIATLVGQTTVDGSDIGDVIFTVCDEFTYYDGSAIIPNNTCAINYITPAQVQQTVFNECCPFMVSVLKGRGTTLLEKAQSIYTKISIDITFNEFYDNILLYGMAKYLVARLLYGKFNINFLLGKYNERILRDLGRSRFCDFLTFFESCESKGFGYNKYFKFDKRGKDAKQSKSSKK